MLSADCPRSGEDAAGSGRAAGCSRSHKTGDGWATRLQFAPLLVDDGDVWVPSAASDDVHERRGGPGGGTALRVGRYGQAEREANMEMDWEAGGAR